MNASCSPPRFSKLTLPSPRRRAITTRPCLLTKATQNNEFAKVDILVATPLRLKSLIEKNKVSLGAVRYLVLDEADKLFEMGFVEQVDAAVAACDGPDITRALFSATLPETVENLARSVMAQPIRLTVGERNSASGTIAQRLVFCGQERGKLLALRQLIDQRALRARVAARVHVDVHAGRVRVDLHVQEGDEDEGERRGGERREDDVDLAVTAHLVFWKSLRIAD